MSEIPVIVKVSEVGECGTVSVGRDDDITILVDCDLRGLLHEVEGAIVVLRHLAQTMKV